MVYMKKVTNSKDFIHKVGDIVNMFGSNVLITENKREPVGPNSNHTKRMDYYRCLDCGYEGKKPDAEIGKYEGSGGCPGCKGNRCSTGFNDMATTHPEYINS